MDISSITEEKRKLLYSPYANFCFQDTDGLNYKEVSLSCIDTNPEETEVGPPIPTYVFDIIVDGQSVGGIELRVGYSLEYYVVGQIGYAIDKPFRGHGYSAKACFALIPLLKKHGFKRIVVTTDENNVASRRSCEKIGATFIEAIDTPKWSVLYDEGQRRTSIYEWIIE